MAKEGTFQLLGQPNPDVADINKGRIFWNTISDTFQQIDENGVIKDLTSENPGGSDTNIQFNNVGTLAGSDNFVFDGTAVGIGTLTPDSSSLLDLTSTARGFLMPVMTTIQRDAIPTPATGLEIYNITTNEPEFFNGSIWLNTGGTAAGGANTQIQFNNNGAFDGISGVTTDGANLFFSDLIKANFGVGEDLQIFHGGADSVIQNLTGNLLIVNQGAALGNIITENFSATNDIINRLGTGTTAVEFRIENNLSTQLFSVDGAGNVAINEGAELRFGTELTISNVTGASEIVSSETLDIRQNALSGHSINITNEATDGDITFGISNTDNTANFRFKDGVATDIFVIQGDGKAVLGPTLESTALLTLDSSTEGFLMPRLSTAQRNAIPTPATGLEIFNTSTNEPEFFDGIDWITTGGTAPGGADTQVQFNNAGAFDGISGVTTDGSNLIWAAGAEARFGGGTEFTIEHVGDTSLINNSGQLIFDQTSTTNDIEFRLGGFIGATGFIVKDTNLNVKFIATDIGNVGIGTATPDSPLHIQQGPSGIAPSPGTILHIVNNTSDAFITLQSAATDSRGILFADGDSNDDGSIIYNSLAVSDGFEFKTGGSVTQMVIDNIGNVGIGTITPDANSLLDISSTTRGFLMPRMTTIQRDAIVTPATGLEIYNITTNEPEFFDGSAWITTGGTAPGGADTEIQFNNNGAFDGSANFVFDGNNVGIGTNLPDSKLQIVDDGLPIPGLQNWTFQSAPGAQWNGVAFGNNTFVAISTSGSQRAMTSPDNGVTWTLRDTPSDIFWVAVDFGNNTFVAVTGNAVMTSTDNGVTWIDQTPATSNGWNELTFALNLFVAVSSSGIDDRVMTSPDGITWTSQTSAEDNSWLDITFGNNLFVAVATTGTNQVMTSPDAITWTSQSASSVNDWSAVGFGNGLFVAVAFNGSVMSSPDGITWTDQTTVIGGGNNRVGIAFGNGFFVVNANVGGSMSSTDGINWTFESRPAGLFGAIAFGSDTFVGVAHSGGDAMNMAATIIPSTALKIDSTTSGFLMPVMTTIERDLIQTPETGLEIFNTTTNEPEFFDGSVWKATAGAETLAETLSNGNVTAGFDIEISAGDALISGSGITGADLSILAGSGSTGLGGDLIFNSGGSTNNNAGTILFLGADGFANGGPILLQAGKPTQADTSGAGIEIAGGGGIGTADGGPVELDGGTPTGTGNIGHVLFQGDGGNVGIRTSSPDSKLQILDDFIGIPELGDWVAQTTTEANAWDGIGFGAGLFVAVSQDGTNRIATSPDGITWTAIAAPAAAEWNAVVFANSQFVVSSSGGINIMTSPDGNTWTSQTVSGISNSHEIGFGAGLYVVVGTSGGVITSPDGITWTVRTAAENNTWRSITFGNSIFVAVSTDGTNRVMTSPDGITWTSRTAATANAWFGVTFGNGLFVAVSNTGTNDRVMTSPDGITWTSQTSSSDSDWRGITFGNGFYVAVGTSRSMTSPDGITWTTENVTSANQWRTVTFGNDLFVTVGRNVTAAMTLSALSFNPNAAILKLDSTTSGFLPPRMTTAERDLLPTPVAGLSVYENLLNAPMFNDGTQWQYDAPVAGPTIIRVRQLSDLPAPINNNINIVAEAVIYLENSIDLGVNNILQAGRMTIRGIAFGLTTLTSSHPDGTIVNLTTDGVTLEDLVVSNTNATPISVALNNSSASLFVNKARFFGELIITAFEVIVFQLGTVLFSPIRFLTGTSGLFAADNTSYVQLAPSESIVFEQGSTVFSFITTNSVFITAPGGFGIVVENPDSLINGEMSTFIDQGAGTLLKCDPISSSNFTPVTGIGNQGIAFDGDGNLIIVDDIANTITRMVGITNVVDVSIAAPGTDPIGVVWLKGDLYSSDNLSNTLFKHNGFSTSIDVSFTAPGTAANMMTTDGTNIIYTDSTDGLIRVLDGFTVTVQQSFSTPAGATLSGITFDGVNLIITDGANDVVIVLEGIGNTEQYRFPIATGASDFADITMQDIINSRGFIGSDLSGNSIYFYDHPVTFDHSSRSWLIGNAAGFLIESSDRGGSQFLGGGNSSLPITAMVLDAWQDVGDGGVDLFYGTFNAMEKCRLFDEGNGELIWTGTRDRGRSIAAQFTIQRTSGAAADAFYEISIAIGTIIQKDSISIGSLPTTGTILTLNSLPITRDLVAGTSVKIQIRTTSTPANTFVFSSRLSIN